MTIWVAVLLLTYGSIAGLEKGIEKVVSGKVQTSQVKRITQSHFIEPEGNILFSFDDQNLLMEEIGKGKRGIPSYRAFYVILALLYLLLLFLVFYQLVKENGSKP